MIQARMSSHWKRVAMFFFAASYLYLLSGFVYAGGPPNWSMRSTNLSPFLSRAIEFAGRLFLKTDPHPQLMAMLFVFSVSLAPTAAFKLMDGWIERRSIANNEPSIRRNRFWVACGILLLFLLFFGPIYVTS